MAGSAQCRSSTTNTKGSRSAVVSRKARQAAKFSSREAAGASKPTRGRSLLRSQDASG
jgi:hypothetical protein